MIVSCCIFKKPAYFKTTSSIHDFDFQLQCRKPIALRIALNHFPLKRSIKNEESHQPLYYNVYYNIYICYHVFEYKHNFIIETKQTDEQ